MFTNLDLLIVVVMALFAVSLLAVVLMFLLRSQKAQRVCLWLVSALGVYLGYVGVRINWADFGPRAPVAVAMALAAIGAVVLERLSKGDEKKLTVARILSAAALLIGMCNAFV